MKSKKSLLPTILVSFGLLFSSATMVKATVDPEIDVKVTVTCVNTSASISPVANKTDVIVAVNATDTIVITLNGISEAKCDFSEKTHNVVLSATEALDKSFIDLPCETIGCPLSDDDMTVTISPMAASDAGIFEGVITLSLVENP
jgi:hypothetical protein